MRISDEIGARISAAFPGAAISVTDDSERHRGHAGWRDGGETHFTLRVRHADLAALSRVARHRAIHAALGDLTGRIHALALDLG